eukprot:1621850-Alexandrium_andersonii.AAC.1
MRDRFVEISDGPEGDSQTRHLRLRVPAGEPQLPPALGSEPSPKSSERCPEPERPSADGAIAVD